MTPRTVLIVCGRAPMHRDPVPAVRHFVRDGSAWTTNHRVAWRCSWCGKRVKVAA